MAQDIEKLDGGGRVPPTATVRLLFGRRHGRAQQPAEARLESRGVRGGENRRISHVVPEPQMAAERRDRQRSAAPAQAGRLQSSAAENRQVSVLPTLIRAQPWSWATLIFAINVLTALQRSTVQR